MQYDKWSKVRQKSAGARRRNKIKWCNQERFVKKEEPIAEWMVRYWKWFVEKNEERNKEGYETEWSPCPSLLSSENNETKTGLLELETKVGMAIKGHLVHRTRHRSDELRESRDTRIAHLQAAISKIVHKLPEIAREK